MDRDANQIAPSERLAARGRVLRAPVFASAALSCLLAASAASAATDVQGTPYDLQLNVRDATIVEILNALSKRFKVTYRVLSPDARVLTGVYSGTLRDTLIRVLEGNDYVLALSDTHLEILVLGASTHKPETPSPNKAATAPTLVPAAAASVARSTAPATSLAHSRPASVSNLNASLSAVSAPPLSSFVVAPTTR
jgi:hypothetical protein